MTTPNVTINLRSSSNRVNPQDLSAIGCVFGYSSAGTRAQVATLGNLAACSAYGFGEGIEHAAEIGVQAGWPVYFCPVEGTQQAPSAVTKTPISAGVATLLYGSALAPGAAPPVGGLLYVAKTAGVSVVQVAGGANGVVVTGSVGAQVITVTFSGATTNGAIATLVNADVTANLLVTASAVGGSGLPAVLASTSLDNGALTATALAAGVTIAIVYAGSGTPLSIPAVVGSAVIINGATDANGLPASTATAIAAYLTGDGGAGATAARLLLTLTAGGTGLGLAAAKATTALQFGSTGAATVAGTGTDAYTFKVRVLSSGTVGGSPAPAIEWSPDNGNTYSSRRLVPGTGIVALADNLLTTGITITFTGALEEGDVFTFTVAKPVVASADLLAALDAVIADTSRDFGFVTTPTSCSRSLAAQINTKIQAVKTTRGLRCFLNTRAIAEGVPGETRAQWINALIADFDGFESVSGPLWVVAGRFSHISSYTGRIYTLGRPGVFQAAARRASSCLHASLGEVALGALLNINFSRDATTGLVVDPGIDHDERTLPALNERRFITLRTFGEFGSGSFYITRFPTMALENDASYNLGMHVNLALECARRARATLVRIIQAPLVTISVAESALVPKGAISAADAISIAGDVNKSLSDLLFTTKSDGRPSASPNPPGVPLCRILRTNNINADKTLNAEIKFQPLGYPDFVVVNITVEVP